MLARYLAKIMDSEVTVLWEWLVPFSKRTGALFTWILSTGMNHLLEKEQRYINVSHLSTKLFGVDIM